MAFAGVRMINTHDQLKGLTEKQRECLRLVSQNYSSKEIGRKLGITHYTVDQRLRTATKNLGVETRFEAARLLASSETISQTISEAFIYHPPHVLTPVETDSQKEPSTERDQVQGTQVRTLREAAGAVWPPQTQGAAWDFNLVSEPGGFWKPRSFLQKLLMALIVMLTSLIAFGAGVTALEVLSRLN